MAGGGATGLFRLPERPGRARKSLWGDPPCRATNARVVDPGALDGSELSDFQRLGGRRCIGLASEFLPLLEPAPLLYSGAVLELINSQANIGDQGMPIALELEHMANRRFVGAMASFAPRMIAGRLNMQGNPISQSWFLNPPTVMLVSSPTASLITSGPPNSISR